MVSGIPFTVEARALTNDHLYYLETLAAQITSFGLQVDGLITWLCQPGHPVWLTAQQSCSGLIVLNGSCLRSIPLEVAAAVGLHELIHVQFRSLMREAVVSRHSDVDRFLHEVLIRDWLQKGTPPGVDNEYIRSKAWMEFRGGRFALSDLGVADINAVLDGYFSLLAGGQLGWEQGSLGHLDDPVENFDFRAQYGLDPKAVALQVMTGMELEDHLYFSWRVNLGRRLGVSFWELEEGFANAVACALTGISLDTLQRYAPQDEFKIRLARQMQVAISSPKQVLLEVRALEELAVFYKAICPQG